MSKVDDIVARIQDIALLVTGVKAAPDYPVDDVSNLPLVITHVTGAQVFAMDGGYYRSLYSISVDVHLPRISLKHTYQLVNSVLPDLSSRLAGDPTLNSVVSTIVFPVTVDVTPAEWDRVVTQMVRFSLTVKVDAAPV